MDIKDDKVLDLSGHGIKKIPRNFVNDKTCSCTEINLNNNDIQKLEFLNGLQIVEKLSASHNQLLRMYGVQSLRNLVHLDLSYNKIICIEGLREMTHLAYLNLSHNKIKELDHSLKKNTRLEFLDVSENIVSHIPNMSHLIKLKALLLHGNLITHLKHSEVYLPKSIEKLTLANNKISDLNEVCHLVDLINLKEISLSGNPCVESTGQAIGVEYRPFLVNWCLALKIIDGFAVNDMECLKGEWLYSQGKGRKFRPGEHDELVKYLAENIPFTGDQLDTEQDRKLRLILSKARENKAPLNPQLGSGKVLTRHTPQMMTRSLDPSLFGKINEHQDVAVNLLTRSLHNTSIESEKEIDKEDDTAPLPAATTLVPVPESLVSPMVANIPDIPSATSKETAQDFPSNEMPSVSKQVGQNESAFSATLDKIKLQAIKSIAEEMKIKKAGVSDKSMEIAHFEHSSGQILGQLLSHRPSSLECLVTCKIPDKGSSSTLFDKFIDIGSQLSMADFHISNDHSSSNHTMFEEAGHLVNAIENMYFEDKDSKARSSSNITLEKKRPSEPAFHVGHSSTSVVQAQRPASAPFLSKPAYEVVEPIDQNFPESSHEKLKRDTVKLVVCQVMEQFEKRFPKDAVKREMAATKIQKVWRGYRARSQGNHQSIVNRIEHQRLHDHIMKLHQDVDAVRASVKSDSRVHMLQIQAINALWRKLSAMQTATRVDQPNVKELAETCARLSTQVEQLHTCMQDVLRVVGRLTSPIGTSVSTQTDITAVHTPDEPSSLFNRPSTLSLCAHSVSPTKINVVGPDTLPEPSENLNE